MSSLTAHELANQRHSKLFGFGFRAFRKYPELIPLVSILSVAASGALGYMGYSLWQKPDVRVVKSSEHPPWERVNAEERQKLLTYNQKYKVIPELEELKKEIGSYKC